MNLKKVPQIMNSNNTKKIQGINVNFSLNSKNSSIQKWNRIGLKKLYVLISEEKNKIFLALFALVITTSGSLIGPYIIGQTIDIYVTKGLVDGLRIMTIILFFIYTIEFVANYVQIKIMGTVGQNVLFKLRNTILQKIEELPLEFFNQNKAGDLISRINSDTSLLSQFFSETLTRFIGGICVIVGAGVFLIVLHTRLGLTTLMPAVLLFIFTKMLSKIVRQTNTQSLTQNGLLSAEIQESLQNFKVIVASNRRDFFQSRFEEINTSTYKANLKARLYNGVFMPIYDFAASLGQYAVLVYGIYLISMGDMTIGLLVTFLAYAEKFYNPLRQLANLWSSIQISIAAWSRISDILELETNIKVIEKISVLNIMKKTKLNIFESAKVHVDDFSIPIENQSVILSEIQNKNVLSEKNSSPLIEFKNVTFYYSDMESNTNEEKKEILHDVSFVLEQGKTYALVGPTGGGKTTTASLIARLFDPKEGVIYLNGKDIRTIDDVTRTKTIGFILQDPTVFAGTLLENLIYGNVELEKKTTSEIQDVLIDLELDSLIQKFDGGLNSELAWSSDTLSLGQRQIIAFIRAVLRKPLILILDEATANIDTVTEKVLEDILSKLPKTTTKVIIAHRLNTIQNADQIFFVNNSKITLAGGMQDAVNMLLHGKRQS